MKDSINWKRVEESIKIENFYRAYVFPNLLKRPGREFILSALEGTSIEEAIYILDFLYTGLLVDGDVCEFGVAQGATSKLLAFEILNTNRNLYLFDSFAGLPAPSPEDVLVDDIFDLKTMDKYKGTMSYSEDVVLEKLKEIEFPLNRTFIMRGWLEEVLKLENIPKKVAFAYVDVDFYSPIKATLEYLDEVMPVGGRIVVDDYGFFSDGVRKAVDEFIQSRKRGFSLIIPPLLPSAGKFALLKRGN